MNKYTSLIVVAAFATSCSSSLAPLRKDGLKPTVVTETVLHDTDDQPFGFIQQTLKKVLLLVQIKILMVVCMCLIYKAKS